MDQCLDIIKEVSLSLSMFYPFLYFISFARNSKAYKIFTTYLIGIAIIQFLMIYTRSILQVDSNLFLFKYYFIFQFLALSYFYKTLLGFRSIYFVTSIALLFFIFQYIEEPELISKYNPLGSAIAQIIIVIYSLLYFYKLLSSKGEFLIVNIGVSFYMLISIMFFAVGNLVLVDSFSMITNIMNNLNSVFYFIFQILIVLEWYKNYSKYQKING